VDLNVPLGTQIFSDRVSIGGRTLAQRAASRKRIINTMRGGPVDSLKKNTLSRLLEEEKLDTAITQMASRNNPPGKAA